MMYQNESIKTKKQLTVYFVDFWNGFDVSDNFILAILKEAFDVRLDDSDPEVVFCSCFGATHLNYDCVRVFYTGENQNPDFNLCDYAIGFDELQFGDRYLRFPNFAREPELLNDIAAGKRIEDLPSLDRNFCNFVYSNANADPVRDEFFRILSAKVQVHSLGGHLRNWFDPIERRNSANWGPGKIEIMRNYNFSIAFENSSAPGYITEKIMHAFAARTIPIYWGDPTATTQFNPKAFVDVASFESLDDCAERVLEIKSSAKKMRQMLSEPAFVGGVVPERFRIERLKEFLIFICDQSPECRSRRTKYGRTAHYELHMKRQLNRIDWTKPARSLRNAIGIRLSRAIRRQVSRSQSGQQ